MNFFRKVWFITWKDIKAEWRTREIFSSMFIFMLLVIVIFNFAIDPGSDPQTVLPGALWIAFTFAGILGLNRSFILERENEAFQGLLLCPVDRGAIYLGKMLGSLLFLSFTELIALPIFIVFFNLSVLNLLPKLGLIILLSTLGFIAVGTLFSAMSVHTKTREIMLPILLFPVVIPVIIGAVRATDRVLAQKPLSDITPWLNLLVAFDVIFLVASFLTFEFVVEE
jgi:heme exporter protein B